MRSLLLALALSLCTQLVGADEKPTVTRNRQSQTTAFLDETYNLAFVHQRLNGDHPETITEYIPAGQTLERWTRLIAVLHYPNIADFQGMPGEVIKVVNSHNPLARSAIHRTPDGSRVMVDFLTWDLDRDFTEFNVFIYQNNPQGPGVIVQQFAMRAYGENGKQLMVDLKDRRVPTLDAVTQFAFPSITSQQPANQQ